MLESPHFHPKILIKIEPADQFGSAVPYSNGLNVTYNTIRSGCNNAFNACQNLSWVNSGTFFNGSQDVIVTLSAILKMSQIIRKLPIVKYSKVRNSLDSFSSDLLSKHKFESLDLL